jgi:hypothetical protein
VHKNLQYTCLKFQLFLIFPWSNLLQSKPYYNQINRILQLPKVIRIFSIAICKVRPSAKHTQGSTSRKIRGIIPFDAQNHVKCAFLRVRLRIRTLIKRYDHVRVYSQKGMTINDLQTAIHLCLLQPENSKFINDTACQKRSSRDITTYKS